MDFLFVDLYVLFYFEYNFAFLAKNTELIQDVSRLVDITAEGYFLGLCDQKSSYKHVSDFGRLRSYGHFLIPPTRPRVNRVLWNQLTGDVLNLVAYRLRKLQRATRAVHNRAAACVAACGGIFEKPALSTDQFKLKIISRS